VIRTFTPRRGDEAAGELDVDIVIHGSGTASRWAATAAAGHPAAVSGPGRGYAVDPDAPAFFLAGDESAIPAISQLLETLPPATPVEVDIEVADPAARLTLPAHPGAVVRWHDLPPGAPPGDALVAAVTRVPLAPDCRVWVAGEAAAVQRVRRHLFEERAVPRTRATVRGYWKQGRTGDTDGPD
jgi:NADPH-dependent ferric siderophore reductase